MNKQALQSIGVRSRAGGALTLMTVSRLITATAATILLVTGTPQAANLTTVVAFDPSKFELPENIAIDRDNNLFVSLILSNEGRKISPTAAQSSYATFTGAFASLTAGL